MTLDPRRVKTLFGQALEHADPAARTAFLDRECGDDPELRHRLEELLAAHDHPASAMERPLGFVPATAAPPDPAAGPGFETYPTMPASDPSALPDWATPVSARPML